MSLKSKILSLDLVFTLFENAGPFFLSSEKFLSAIQQYLCTSLFANSVSANFNVVGLSLRIFVHLQTNFRERLKTEMEMFITKIFLPILESTNSALSHKLLVLEVFMRTCNDLRTLVEIFQLRLRLEQRQRVHAHRAGAHADCDQRGAA